MRSKILSLSVVFFLSSLAQAAPKKAPELMQALRKSRGELTAEKSKTVKSTRLKDFEKDFETTLEEYRKLNPDLGGDDESAVGHLYESLRPAFALASSKMTTKDCDKAKHDVSFGDLLGKPEDAKLSADALEAQSWVELFCK